MIDVTDTDLLGMAEMRFKATAAGPGRLPTVFVRDNLHVWATGRGHTRRWVLARHRDGRFLRRLSAQRLEPIVTFLRALEDMAE